MSEQSQSVFDPFGTFHSKGYLENSTAEKDLDKVKRMEHLAFTARLEQTLEMLAATEEISYSTVLKPTNFCSRTFITGLGVTDSLRRPTKKSPKVMSIRPCVLNSSDRSR